METLTFVLLAAISIAAAFGLLLSKNAVYAALFLILNFGTVAVFYLLLNAPFLAAIQISVYTGAIMVLFLFVIMLLGAEKLAPVDDRVGSAWQRPLAMILGVGLFALAFVVIAGGTSALAPVTAVAAVDSSPLAVGKLLLTTYGFPFEVISVLLLIAMIGAVVLTRDK
jgi:NADH-quinone oxidoreductase subunit J